MSGNRYEPPISFTILSIGWMTIVIKCVSAKFPCMNDGTPILAAHNSEFKCECKRHFYGPFCEYDSITKNEETVDRQIIKVVLCVFFLLLLPTLIIYLIRTFYLFLKRCGENRTSPARGQDGCEESYGAVVEAAANIVFQQQQQQQQQPQQQQQQQQQQQFPGRHGTLDRSRPFVFEEGSLQIASGTPTITLLPLFNFPTDAPPTTRHRSGRGLRRTRTAAGEVVAADAADASRNHHRALHITRSLAYGGGGATFTIEEFSQLLRGLQGVQRHGGNTAIADLPPLPPAVPPPPYDCAINNDMSFI